MGLLVLAALLCVTGIVLVIFFFSLLIKWRSVRNWDAVPADVISKGLKKKEVKMWPAAIIDEYIPSVEYRYEYYGVPYSGKNLTVRDVCLATTEESEAMEYVEAAERNATAYVNPSMPSKSFLISELSWSHMSFVMTYFLIGVIAIVIGALIFYIA